jgi:hypothetical protein
MPSSDAPKSAPIPDDDHGADLPMNMSASVMLTNLPRDATQALADVETIDTGKGASSPSAVGIATNNNKLPCASSLYPQPRF